MYTKSNRKSGSPSQKIGSPPYFYFRFGLQRPCDARFCRIRARMAAVSPVLTYMAAPLFLEIRESDFGFFFANCKYVRPTIDPENLNKIATPRFEQISLKVGKKRDISLFPKSKFSKSRGRYNKLMLKFPRWSRNGAR